MKTELRPIEATIKELEEKLALVKERKQEYISEISKVEEEGEELDERTLSIKFRHLF